MAKPMTVTDLARMGGKTKSKAKKAAALRNLYKAHKARKYKKPIPKVLIDAAKNGS